MGWLFLRGTGSPSPLKARPTDSTFFFFVAPVLCVHSVVFPWFSSRTLFGACLVSPDYWLQLPLVKVCIADSYVLVEGFLSPRFLGSPLVAFPVQSSHHLHFSKDLERG